MYILYACDQKGQGKVMQVGEFESVEDIEIIVSMFDKDVVLTIEEENKE